MQQPVVVFITTGEFEDLTRISLASFNGACANSAELDHTPQNVAFVQGIHCLLTVLFVLLK